METESKYLKKIRDEIEKKSGKTVTHEGPNTVPNYLNDISKAVKNLDIGGGGGGIIEGPFSFTNETKRGTGNKTTDSVEISNDVVDYKSVTTNSDGMVIKELKINPASADNSYPNVEIKTKIDNADIPDIITGTMINEWGLVSSQKDVNGDEWNLTARFGTLAIGKYDKSTDKGTVMDVRPDDIVMTGTAGNTWDGDNTSLKAALSRLPAVMKIITSSSGTIDAGEDVDFNMTLDSTKLRNIRDIHSWSVLCSQDTVRYITLPIKNLRFTQSDTIGVGHPHMMQFTLENNTGSDIVLNEVVFTLLYYRESSYT